MSYRRSFFGRPPLAGRLAITFAVLFATIWATDIALFGVFDMGRGVSARHPLYRTFWALRLVTKVPLCIPSMFDASSPAGPRGPSDSDIVWLSIGIALNGVVWGHAIADIVSIPRRLRARRKTRPNTCHACGYDLRGSPSPSHPCPECGAAPDASPM